MSCKSDNKIKEDNTFSIKGTINRYDFKNIEVELHQAIDERGRPEKTQTTQMRNGEFVFEGKIEHPAFASIIFYEGDTIKYTFNFFNEAKNINLSVELPLDFKPVRLPAFNNLDYNAAGSPKTSEYKEYLKLYRDFFENSKTLQKKLQVADNDYYDALFSKEPDSALIKQKKFKNDSLKAVWLSLEKEFKKQYALKNKESVISLHVLLNEYGPKLFDGSFEVPEINNILEELKSLKEVPLYKSTRARYTSIVGLKIGDKAPDFSLENPSGEIISLSGFKGKYVLIDFWAYYCGPCIAKIPKLKKTYAKYKDQGLEIIGIHGDKNAKKWLGVIKKHQQTWPQVIDKNAFKENSAVIKYGVQGFPAVFMVDPEGNLIEKNIANDDLENILIKIFKN
ncbi:TlpA disulfide reductase family protein [Flavivirga rizhaonensis]|nr:TlpA disulfide reductase family protein [Flavivirga rizhaonensis]